MASKLASVVLFLVGFTTFVPSLGDVANLPVPPNENMHFSIGFLDALDVDNPHSICCGQEAAFSALLAVDLLNVAPDVLKGITLHVVFNSTDSNPSTAIFATIDQIENDNVLAVIGELQSDITAQIQFVASYYDILQVSYGSTGTKLSDKDSFPTLARVIPPDSEQGACLAAFMQELGWSQVGVIHSNDAYSSGLVNEFLLAAGEYDVTPASVHTFAAGQERVDRQIKDLKDTGLRVILLVAAAPDARTVMLEAMHQGMTSKGYAWLGTDAWVDVAFASDETLTEDYVEALQGVVGTTPPYDFSNPLAAAVNRMWKQRDPVDWLPAVDPSAGMGQWGAYSFDAVLSIAYSIDDLITKQGYTEETITSADVLRRLKLLEYDGVTGSVRFNSTTGDRLGFYSVKNIQGYETVEVGKTRVVFTDEDEDDWDDDHDDGGGDGGDDDDGSGSGGSSGWWDYSEASDDTPPTEKESETKVLVHVDLDKIIWPGGTNDVPLDILECTGSEVEMVDGTCYDMTTLYWVFGVEAALVQILIVSMMVCLFLKRDHALIRAASAPFCILVCIGALLMTVCVYVDIHQWCYSVRMWFFGLAFAIMYGSLFGKTYRIYRLACALVELRKAQYVKNQDVLKLVVAIVLIETSLLTWIELDGGYNALSDTFASQSPGQVLLFIFHVVLLSWGGFLAHAVRGMKKFGDAPNVAYAVFCTFVIMCMWFPLSLATEDDPVSRFLIDNLVSLLLALFTVSVLFLRKLFQVMFVFDGKHQLDTRSLDPKYPKRPSKQWPGLEPKPSGPSSSPNNTDSSYSYRRLPTGDGDSLCSYPESGNWPPSPLILPQSSADATRGGRSLSGMTSDSGVGPDSSLSQRLSAYSPPPAGMQTLCARTPSPKLHSSKRVGRVPGRTGTATHKPSRLPHTYNDLEGDSDPSCRYRDLDADAQSYTQSRSSHACSPNSHGWPQPPYSGNQVAPAGNTHTSHIVDPDVARSLSDVILADDADELGMSHELDALGAPSRRHSVGSSCYSGNYMLAPQGKGYPRDAECEPESGRRRSGSDGVRGSRGHWLSGVGVGDASPTGGSRGGAMARGKCTYPKGSLADALDSRNGVGGGVRGGSGYDDEDDVVGGGGCDDDDEMDGFAPNELDTLLCGLRGSSRCPEEQPRPSLSDSDV
eukprot:Rmarinus@m.19577